MATNLNPGVCSSSIHATASETPPPLSLPPSSPPVGWCFCQRVVTSLWSCVYTHLPKTELSHLNKPEKVGVTWLCIVPTSSFFSDSNEITWWLLVLGRDADARARTRVTRSQEQERRIRLRRAAGLPDGWARWVIDIALRVARIIPRCVQQSPVSFRAQKGARPAGFYVLFSPHRWTDSSPCAHIDKTIGVPVLLWLL